MLFVTLITLVTGVTGCVRESDAAFCGPDFTAAMDGHATALQDPMTPDIVGMTGTAVVLAHDAGCA